MELTVQQKRFVQRLYELGGIKFGNFTLRSGRNSRWYIDLRVIQSDPQLLRLAALELAFLLRDVVYDCIAAIPVAAMTFVTMTANAVDKPMITPRIDEKKHGTAARIDGVFKAGERVALCDDLGTTGGAKLDALVSLLKAGLVPIGIFLVFSREQGAEEELDRHGYRVHAAITARDALGYLHDAGVVADDIFAEIMDDWRQGRLEAGLSIEL